MKNRKSAKRSNLAEPSSKNRPNNSTSANATEKSSTSAPCDNDFGEERSFSEWLRQEDGLGSMKLFVVVNSIVVFGLMAWPNMKQTLLMIYEYFTDLGDDTPIDF